GGRLREAMVEAAASRPGGVNQHAVEHFATGLVGVETLVQEVAEKASALRDAHGDRGGDRELGPRIVAGPRHDVADRGESDPDDDGIAGAIDELVDLAALEPAGEGDMRGIVHQPAILAAVERPPLA